MRGLSSIRDGLIVVPLSAARTASDFSSAVEKWALVVACVVGRRKNFGGGVLGPSSISRRACFCFTKRRGTGDVSLASGPFEISIRTSGGLGGRRGGLGHNGPTDFVARNGEATRANRCDWSTSHATQRRSLIAQEVADPSTTGRSEHCNVCEWGNTDPARAERPRAEPSSNASPRSHPRDLRNDTDHGALFVVFCCLVIRLHLRLD